MGQDEKALICLWQEKRGEVGPEDLSGNLIIQLGLAGLVCAVALCKSKTLCSLAAMSWQRPDNGSRMNREVHVRFWERAEVKFLRATRQNENPALIGLCQLPPAADVPPQMLTAALAE